MRTLLTTLLLCLCMGVSGQRGASDIAKEDRIVFFGLDFSFLKLVHREGFVDKNGKPMCNTLTFKYFTEWNDMFVIERKKFNLSRYFGVPDYVINMDKVAERNKAYATDECITESDSRQITDAELAEAVEGLESDGSATVGCVIFVESFNKVDRKAKVISVFFNVTDGSIIRIDRQEGAPVGDGFRNYWINAVDNALDKGSSAYKR